MPNSSIIRLVAALAFATGFSASVQAAASRTFVSSTGNDSNTSSDCGATGPCRTFGAALSVTSAGGEIVVLDSGGYGPATISQSVIITAIDVDASISAASGGIGIGINTTGAVTLIGLSLYGEGIANYGIYVGEVGFLRLYGVLIENFVYNGVDLNGSSKAFIYDCTINDNGLNGVIVNNSPGSADIYSSSFDHNNAGVLAVGHVTVTDSSAEYNSIGFVAQGGTLTMFNDRAVFNTIGLNADVDGTLYFADSLISNNETAYQIVNGSMFGTGTSLIAPGQATLGILSAPIALH